ncbi:unnamed protein product [Ranitomeya imitator]|uniref:Uncharacterized protein n=1 Tax=Ranitomeya imitator TaxID=111125 RepID=A0ABN9KVR4_9NEOB|nr:unnamed protein product [Ranitomeya imitator]
MVGPVPVITFLGIVIDSEAMEIRLRSEKIIGLIELINGCLSAGKVSLTQMQSLLGSLNFACRMMAMGRIFSRRLALATRGVKQPHHRIRITSQLRVNYNGRTCFQEEECDIGTLDLFFEAAGPAGFSVRFGKRCAEKWHGHWFTKGGTKNVTLLELFTIAVAVES